MLCRPYIPGVLEGLKNIVVLNSGSMLFGIVNNHE